MMKGLKESALALAVAAAGVSSNGALAEDVKAHGHYTVVATGPVEEFRAEYVRLRDLAAEADAAGDVARREYYLDELGSIPMEEKWNDTWFPNLVTTAGKNDLLDKYFAGSAYTAAWYLGLVDGGSAPTYAAGDTASSHAGWTEFVNYAAATRPAPTFNAAASSSKATTATAFAINGAGGVVAGCFMITNSTKSGTTGILYSCGSFTGGNKTVANGDTLNVTYTAGA